jgi:hypothetical protein
MLGPWGCGQRSGTGSERIRRAGARVALLVQLRCLRHPAVERVARRQAEEAERAAAEAPAVKPAAGSAAAAAGNRAAFACGRTGSPITLPQTTL